MEIESLTSLRDLSGMMDAIHQTVPRIDLSKGEFDSAEFSTKKKPKIDAPIVDFFKKLYGGIGNVFKQARTNRKNKKAEGAKFKDAAKEWGKTLSKGTKTLLMAELLPQLKHVLGIPSIKKIAEDKGLSAAILEGFKMGFIDAVTLATYFGILVPFVASGAATAVNTLLNNIPFLKPYLTKVREQEEAETQKKAQEDANNTAENTAAEKPEEADNTTAVAEEPKEVNNTAENTAEEELETPAES